MDGSLLITSNSDVRARAVAWAQEHAARVAAFARVGAHGLQVTAGDALGPAFIAAMAALRAGFEPDARAVGRGLAAEIRGGRNEINVTPRPGEVDQITSATALATDLAASGTADTASRHHGAGWQPPRACVRPGFQPGTGRDGNHRRWLDGEYQLAQLGQLAFAGAGFTQWSPCGEVSR